MPFDERNRLMDHVMDVDQHVRYALVLQAGLGLALAGLLGYLPGGSTLLYAACAGALCWLALVEISHRARKTGTGASLASLDRGLRYGLIAALAAAALAATTGHLPLPRWLSWKLLAFAAVVACGLGIRLALVRFFEVWADIARYGTTPTKERAIRHIYVQATAILGLLWVGIAAIVALSILKPV